MLGAGLIAYNVKLGLKNIRRNPVLSGLMVVAIAVGIGASMAMITINYRFAQNPIPAKSGVLDYIRLDSWSAEFPFANGERPPSQMTYLDATALLRAHRAFRQVAMSRASVAVEPENPDERPFFVEVRATTGDFFAMFDVPFEYGTGWPPEADDAAEPVVVLKRSLNERLFGGEDSVGRTIALSGEPYRIVGVLDDWRPQPKFYDISSGGPAGEIEDVFLPWSLIVAKELPRRGNTNCWKPIEGDGFEAFLNSECIWIQFWAELRNEAERRDYLSFLDAYVTEQKALGRFPRPLDNRATPVMEWLEENNMVPDQARVLLGLSLIFLVVCLLNTIGLLLSKFLGKAPEIGVRRALGASRRTLFEQYLVEAGLIGAAGGALGLVLTWLALRGIGMQFDDDLGALLSLDWTMAFAAVALAVVASLLTAIYPTWRACNVQPAAYLNAH